MYPGRKTANRSRGAVIVARTTPGAYDTPLPSNLELADRFQAIADYLALDGAAIYRVLAYEKAATLFREHPTSVAELAAGGDLRTLPGVGEAIEAKVLEYLSTGGIAFLSELGAKYPEGVLELIRLPGVGPKMARKLWDALGVAGIDALEEACAAGRVRTLPGAGRKTEENLLKAIGAYRARAGRHLLGLVEPLAERLASGLRALPVTSAADFAGSLRRRRSTVRDIDLVVASDRPEAVAEAFAASPEVAAIDERGATKVVGRSHTGLGIDLRIVPPASYGNLLQHFTGSGDHNIALRGYAQRLGYKVSEYHVEEVDSGRRHAFPTEAQVYELLGLTLIPPELRENQGELEASRAGTLPRLIERNDLRGDLHVHSDWSDGRATMEQMAAAARERGLEYLCFCDHSQSLGMGVGLTPDRVLEEIDAVRSLDGRVERIRLLAGSEVDILADGRIDLPDEVLAQLDFVTASIHSGFGQSRAQIMRRLTAALENPNVDAIGHPTGRLLDRREPYEVDFRQLAELAAQTGTILEINAAFDRLDLPAPAARLAHSLGARIAICSDAHAPAGFDLLRYGIGEARRAWLEARDVVNTLPVDEFLALLHA